MSMILPAVKSAVRDKIKPKHGPFGLTDLFLAGEQGALYTPWDLSTMFQDAAGTTPAAIDSPVGLLLDQSGNGNDASQSTDAARPILREDAEGLRYLEFDGVDDHLNADTVSIPQPVTHVASALFSGNVKYLFSTTDGTGTNRMDLTVVDDTTPDYRIFAGGSVIANDEYTSGETSVITTAFNGGSSALRKNGNDVASGNAGSNQQDGLRLGASYSDGNHFPGRLYGLVVVGGELSNDATGNAETELAKRAGVTL